MVSFVCLQFQCLLYFLKCVHVNAYACTYVCNAVSVIFANALRRHADTKGHLHTHTHSSDPHSIVSLLVQQLLTQFRDTFLTTSQSSDGKEQPSTDSSIEKDSLKEFLCQDLTLLLLLAVHLISQQVHRDGFFPSLSQESATSIQDVCIYVGPFCIKYRPDNMLPSILALET